MARYRNNLVDGLVEAGLRHSVALAYIDADFAARAAGVIFLSEVRSPSGTCAVDEAAGAVIAELRAVLQGWRVTRASPFCLAILTDQPAGTRLELAFGFGRVSARHFLQ
jgi:hypothetical protein